MSWRTLVLVLSFAVACGPMPIVSPSERPTPERQPTTIASPSPTAVPTVAATDPSPLQPHVFVIVMENASFGRVLASRPFKALAERYGVATNYHANARPSLPNYLAMTSGSTWDITDNGYHALPPGGLGSQLTDAGIAWRAYMEGMTDNGCLNSPYPYALKHNPFAYYGDGCPDNVVPFEQLDADLAGVTPSFIWVTPGLCHDGHDCSLEVAGAWLDALVSSIVSSQAWHERGVLFIVWDEGDGGDETNHVPLIVATSAGGRLQSDTPYDHFSLLATIEDLFGLPRLRAAATAQPLTELIANPSR